MNRLFVIPKRKQSRTEEIANALSHGTALVAAILATPYLIIHAAQVGDAAFIVGVSIFCATMVLLYSASTFYHLATDGKGKRILRVFDHSAIFLLIAGTYTPFTLGAFRGAWGWSLFGTTWGVAAIGVALKVIYKKLHPIISTTLYLLMGWIIVIAFKPFISHVPIPGVLWLVAGGVSYTVGVVFFALDARLRYSHFIWHLFVMAGTLCHYVAIYRYAA
ncbi:hemolysin III [Desulfuromusa kysingii]|uniref:Hemolysin III n=1 Tax=Desulfuromusa kysingii TaxID=37625 RepID=A0A1H4AYP6_9BACT|nr:hemolysin III [Desulfuromusa kysingii]